MRMPFQAQPVLRITSSSAGAVWLMGVVPADCRPTNNCTVSDVTRDLAAQVIRQNCHNLQFCNAGTGRAAACDRERMAGTCVNLRMIVDNYYRERGLPDPGNHTAAIHTTAEIAQSCSNRCSS